MKIKNIEVGNLFLAPLAGVSDVGFRRVCAKAGASLCYTEMISSKALLYQNRQTLELLSTYEGESPCAVQIFGHDAEEMALACKSPHLQKFDIIDINMGCPAPKVIKSNDGAALLKNLDLIKQIVTACVNATEKPITVKFRMGFKNGDNVAIEVAKICEEAGASAITIHGRYAEQMYSGDADLETIAKVKKAVNIPVVGNGDVFDVVSYEKMKKTGVDAVMIARGAFGNPWIFSKLQGKEINGKMQDIKLHIETLKKFFEEKFVLMNLRKHFLWYLKDYKNAKKAKNEICTCSSLEECIKILEQVICD